MGYWSEALTDNRRIYVIRAEGRKGFYILMLTLL